MTSQRHTPTLSAVVHSTMAPRPTRASFARSLYDALSAIGGPATLQDIIEMIPATDDAKRWSKAKPNKILKLLVQNRSYGYFIETPDGMWKIAPIDYFKARQEHQQERVLNPGTRKKTSKQRSRKIIEVVRYRNLRPIEWTVAISASLVIGYIFGYAAG